MPLGKGEWGGTVRGIVGLFKLHAQVTYIKTERNIKENQLELNKALAKVSG